MKIPSEFKPEQLVSIYICAILFIIEVEYFFWVGLIYLACQLIGLQFTWGGATIIAILGVILINLMKRKSDEETEDEDADEDED